MSTEFYNSLIELQASWKKSWLLLFTQPEEEKEQLFPILVGVARRIDAAISLTTVFNPEY